MSIVKKILTDELQLRPWPHVPLQRQIGFGVAWNWRLGKCGQIAGDDVQPEAGPEIGKELQRREVWCVIAFTARDVGAARLALAIDR